jgi:hypothetical protein
MKPPAHLAVVNDVDPELHLLADDAGDGASHARRVGLAIVGLALPLGLDQPEEVGGARQAARMGGEDAVLAALHGVAFSSVSIFFNSAARRRDLLKGTPALAYQ